MNWLAQIMGVTLDDADILAAAMMFFCVGGISIAALVCWCWRLIGELELVRTEDLKAPSPACQRNYSEARR